MYPFVCHHEQEARLKINSVVPNVLHSIYSYYGKVRLALGDWFVFLFIRVSFYFQLTIA